MFECCFSESEVFRKLSDPHSSDLMKRGALTQDLLFSFIGNSTTDLLNYIPIHLHKDGKHKLAACKSLNI